MKLNWNKDQIYIKISKLLDQMVNIAQSDEIITEDEEAIIENCRQNLWSAHKKFEEYIINDTKEEEIINKITQIFDGALSKAVDTAKADGTINADELKLIAEMKKFIQKEIKNYLK